MGQVKPKATYKAEQKTNEAALKSLQQLQKQPPHATPRDVMPEQSVARCLISVTRTGGGNVASGRNGGNQAAHGKVKPRTQNNPFPYPHTR